MKQILRITQVSLLFLVMLASLSSHLQAAGVFLSDEEVEELIGIVSSVTGRTFEQIPQIVSATDNEVKDVYFAEQDIMDEIYVSKGATNLYRKWVYGLILGKYSWNTKTIYLVKDTLELYATRLNMEPAALEKMVLTHELIHALDDQDYDMKGLLSRALTQDNMMAVTALIEGHAMFFAESVYIDMGIDQNTIDNLWSIDTAYLDSLAFLYIKGLDFITYVFDHSMLTGAELFLHPPLQTDLILQPEKYLEAEEEWKVDLGEFFGKEVIDELPLHFQFATHQSVNNFNLLIGLSSLGGDENLLKGFESGYTYQFYEQLEKPAEMRLPLIITDLMDWQKGFLVVTVMKFTTPTNAQHYWEFSKASNEKQWANSTPNIPSAIPNFAVLTNAYQHSYINYKHSEHLGELFYFLPLLKEQYVVEIAAINLKATPEQIARIMQTIEKRIP